MSDSIGEQAARANPVVAEWKPMDKELLERFADYLSDVKEVSGIPTTAADQFIEWSGNA